MYSQYTLNEGIPMLSLHFLEEAMASLVQPKGTVRHKLQEACAKCVYPPTKEPMTRPLFLLQLYTHLNFFY